MTITKPLVIDGKFMGIVGCDISMNEMKNLFENVRFNLKLNINNFLKRSYFKNSFVFIVNQNGTILFNTHISIVSAYEITETEYTNITESEWLKINDKNTENLTLSVNKGKNIIVRRFIDFNIPDVNQFYRT